MIIKSYEDLFKKEVISETKLLKSIVNNIVSINQNLKNDEISLLNKINDLHHEINYLQGDFTSDLQMNKENLLNYCNNLKINFESDPLFNGDITTEISKINNELDELSKQPRVDNIFLDESDNLESNISNINIKLKNEKSILEQYETSFNDLNSDFSVIVASLNKIAKIKEDLNELKETFIKIDDDISNQLSRQKSLKSNLENLYNNIKRLNTDLSLDLDNIKLDIIDNLIELNADLYDQNLSEVTYDPQLLELNGKYDNLIHFSMEFNVYESNYLLLKKGIENIQYLIQFNDDILNQFEIRLNSQKENYDELLEELNNQKENEKENSQEDINDKLKKYNELLEAGLISQEDYNVLKQNIVKNNIHEEGSDDKIKNNEYVLEFRKFIKGPFFGFIRNQFHNISDEEIQSILKEIEWDIVQGIITNGNWNAIIKEHFESFNQGAHVKKLNDYLDDLISNSEFYFNLSQDYNDLSEDDKNESINELKDSFSSDFKKEDIPTLLKILFEQKRKQNNDLKLLNEYWDNLNIYMSKYNIYENELINLLDLAQSDIYASKLSEISFEDYMLQQINNLIENNKTDARTKFMLFVNKKSKLKEITQLNDVQVDLLIDEVQLLIHNNMIREKQITEEFLIKCSVKFRK